MDDRPWSILWPKNIIILRKIVGDAIPSVTTCCAASAHKIFYTICLKSPILLIKWTKYRIQILLREIVPINGNILYAGKNTGKEKRNANKGFGMLGRIKAATTVYRFVLLLSWFPPRNHWCFDLPKLDRLSSDDGTIPSNLLFVSISQFSMLKFPSSLGNVPVSALRDKSR